MKRLDRMVLVLSLLTVTVVLAIGSSLLWDFTADDSFITYRYSENLGRGFGLRWNPNEEPVEGYTTFLWVVILSIAHVLGSEIVLFSKLVGFFAICGTVLISMRLLQEIGRGDGLLNPLSCVVPALFLSIYPESSVHAVSGMETALFTVLLSLYLLAFCRLTSSFSPMRGVWLALVGLLVGLTRPEGNLVIVISVFAALILGKQFRRVGFILPVLLIYVVPGAAYFVLRAAYFGHLLPAAFYIKAALSNVPGTPGWRAVAGFCKHNGIIGIAAMIGISRLRRSSIPIVLAMVAFALFYIFPKHIMSYYSRFLYPAFPVLIVLSAYGIETIVRWARKRSRPGRILMALSLAGSAFLLQFFFVLRSWPGAVHWADGYGQGLRKAHISLGKLLREIDGSRMKIVALQDAGAISFFSRWHVVDMVGLNNEYLAFQGYDMDEILGQNPDVVVMNSYKRESYEHWGFDHKLYDAFISRGMKLATIYTFVEGQYYLFVLAYPGTPIWRGLTRASQAIEKGN